MDTKMTIIPQKFYAMDFAFYNSMGLYSFQDRCEIIKEVGYDAMHWVAWDGRNWEEALRLGTVKEKFDLEVAGVYIVLDLSLGEHDIRNSGILKMLEIMPEGSTVELAIQSAGRGIRPSEETGDVPVMAWLKKALLIAERRGIRILLYTHIQHWIDKHSDALRVCEKMNHPNLGMIFSSGNWYMGEGNNLSQLLKKGMPYIKQVNLAGARRSPLGFFKVATIEPLDMGELDNFAVVALLKRMGYTGYIGYTGWDEGGDVYNKLERSLKMLKDIDRRINAHPHWGNHLNF
ncbi:Sugar phosphate isomerase/epimerase [Chryseobacterium soldanellicola]|uniref:Sugar phosphate isomerase/epimerase n=1 Tax=Chryseobacterium soldanellicola TaxID=311333 RepID=A0A1H1FBI0_9FLAO|nr:TIM barrel protein [Chryseobacterium soldanellicola]SDQ98198.1 Sugar phosphate isomerase/epimerase [Chryseobacterium soldanellicola]